MKPQSLIEVLDAAHLTYHVNDKEFPSRGGLMIVGPPGVLKTSFINAAFGDWPEALILSDINVNQMRPLRDDFISGRFRTLAFTAFEKLYQRNPASAANLEGHISALVEEGFSRTAHEDSRMATLHARALVCGAMPYGFYSDRFKDWDKSGFARRFLWITIRLADHNKLIEAIMQWKRITLATVAHKEPRGAMIRVSTEPTEARKLRNLIRGQPGDTSPLILMQKIHAVLSWKYNGDSKQVWSVLNDFGESLHRDGAEVEL